MLTVRDREEDKIAALDAGADDYVTKPFGTGELLARLRAAMRHAQSSDSRATYQSAGLEVDLVARVVRDRGRDLKLTPTEYALLRLFVTHPGRVLTHRHLLTEVWGPQAAEQTHYLRVHIAHLRDKLGHGGGRLPAVMTEAGVGYRWVEPP
jgi:two-component system KDP operon response regulator KdpE